MKHTMQHDWLEKWITNISLLFSCLSGYVRMSISQARYCDKIEDICAALGKLAEAQTQKLKELKKKVKTPQERMP